VSVAAVPAVAPGRRCACGAREVHVVFKCPVYAVVVDGRVARVVVARDCAEGPIVAECAGCGASDVDADVAASAAREVAEDSPWPDISQWKLGW
jgi:hypothetical protein